MGGFPAALLFLLALPGSCMSREDLQVFLQAEGDSFRAKCSYNIRESLHKMKFWCKELSEEACPVLAFSFPLIERTHHNSALRHSVDLTDTGRGWISVTMRALRKDDSGTYQCGMWGDLQKILLQRIKIVVSAEETVRLFAKEGSNLSLHCSYSAIDNIRKLQHLTWCKMVSRIRCQPIIRGNIDQSIVKEGKTEMMNDFSWKMIRVWLKKLQFNDSGEYHLESHFQGRTKPLKRIMLEVLGEYWNLDTDLEAISFSTEKQETAKLPEDSNVHYRNLYALMALSTFLATTALIATVILLTTIYIRRKRAGKRMGFARQATFRQAVLQKDGRNHSRRMPDGDPKDNGVYAVIGHQPQLKPEDTYVNIQPSPKVFFHLQEPGSNSVEYATVIFRATTSHSETEKK